MAFACVGILMFGKAKKYNDLYSAIIMLFESSMGAWDLGELYEIYGEKAFIGEIFNIVFIVVNLIVMLNLIIAIMSDTYG